MLTADEAVPDAKAVGDGRSVPQRWRLELMTLGLFALVLRVAYVLAYKHPVFVGGDAYFYHQGANLLVDGHGFIDAYRYRNGVVAQTADHPPGIILVLAAASLLGMRSFFWHQLEMCVLGSLTVVVIALIGRELGGRRAGLVAGFIAAIYPNLWFNDALVMSETLVQFTTAVAVLVAYRWWRRPTARRAAWLGVAVAVCALSRAEAVLFVPLLVAPLILLDRRYDWRERIKQAVIAGVVAGAVLAPWVGYNLSRFEQPVTISTGFDPTVTVSNCDDVYYGEITGYWSRPCILRLPAPTTGDVSTQEAAYRKMAFEYIRHHKSRLPTVVAARVGRTWGLFRPIQQIRLDRIETREIGFSKVGLAMYYALATGTVAAVAMMRRRRVPVSPLLATIAVVTFATAITFGQTRYRASAEPVLVVGAAIAIAFVLRRVLGVDPDEGPALAEPPTGSLAGGRAGLPASLPAGRQSAGAGAGASAGADGVAALAPKRHRDFPCFDGLRAIAAGTVVLVHTAFPSGFSTRNHRWGAYTSRLEIGVSVFFLLSGFLLYRPFVAAHLGGRPMPAMRPYLRRRFLRIVPAYWLALAVAAYVLHTVSPPINNWKAVVVYFGFLQIYSSHYVLHGLSAAWTLCVEMSFYLFLPVYALAVAAWARRSGKHRLRVEVIGLLGLFVFSVLWRVAVFWNPSGQQTSASTWLPAQLDQFVLGMGLAVASVWWSDHGNEPRVLARRWVPWASWATALAFFWAVSHIGLPRVPIYLATLRQVLARQWLYAAFGFFLMLPAVFGPQDQGLIRRLLRSRPFVAAGVTSYGIYLWHETWMLKVVDWLHRPLFATSFVKLTVAVVIPTVACATLSYFLVEQPFQRLGRRRVRRAPPSPDGGGGSGVAGAGSPPIPPPSSDREPLEQVGAGG